MKTSTTKILLIYFILSVFCGVGSGKVLKGYYYKTGTTLVRFAWSQDERYVAYSDLKNLRLLDLNTFEITEIIKAGSMDYFDDIKFSPDNSKISFNKYDHGLETIYIYDINTNKLSILPAGQKYKRYKYSFTNINEWKSNDSIFTVNNFTNVENNNASSNDFLFSEDKLHFIYSIKYDMSYDDQMGHETILYNAKLDRQIKIMKEVFSPVWDKKSECLYYLNKIGNDLNIHRLSTFSYKDTIIKTLTFSDANKYATWGAVMVCLPQSGNFIIGAHLSFVTNNMLESGYQNNTVGESYRFYIYDTKNNKIEPLYKFVGKPSSAPPIPRIIIQPNPVVNGVLVEINSEFYYLDITNRALEKIFTKYSNFWPSDSFELRGESLISKPHIALWSNDGKRLCLRHKYAGFAIVDFD